jgi:hypothetical protein
MNTAPPPPPIDNHGNTGRNLPARKIIQIATCTAECNPTEIYALADDGTLWCRNHSYAKWYPIDISVITEQRP